MSAVGVQACAEEERRRGAMLCCYRSLQLAELHRTDLHERLLDRYGKEGESFYMPANGL